MTKNSNAKCVMLPHSQAKVEFYQRYLELYLIILTAAKFTREINIYDLFCGRGVYDDGGLGSAIRSYETILKVSKEHQSKKRIILHLNDKRATFVKNIQTYISTHYANESAPCHVVYSHRDAIDLLNDIYDNSLIRQQGQGVVNFFFIDPYGYKGITRKMLVDIMNTGNSEILLFLPVSFMHRFTHYAFDKRANRGAQPLRKMIESFFPEDHPIRSDEAMDIDTYIRNLSEAFQSQCKCFTTSYSIERNSSNKFALFFFSRNPMGFENMLNIKWKMVDSYGFGYHLADDEHDLFHDFFREEQKKKKLDLYKKVFTFWLFKASRTNRDIYLASLNAGYLPKHANAVLRELQDNNQLRISDIYTKEVIKKKNMFRITYSEHKRPTLLFQLLCEPQK